MSKSSVTQQEADAAVAARDAAFEAAANVYLGPQQEDEE